MPASHRLVAWQGNDVVSHSPAGDESIGGRGRLRSGEQATSRGAAMLEQALLVLGTEHVGRGR